MKSRVQSEERVVGATPEAIFDILANPSRHGEIDGSGSVKGMVTGPDRLGLGDRFAMSMRLGLPYRVTNKVVEFEENRLIAWCHFGGHRWRWELEPASGPGGESATLVRETFDWTTSKFPWALAITGAPERSRTAIVATLDRLAQVTGRPSP
ncbi:MAG: SRPBCC family protein [Acidimicrobiales bacterium]